MTRLSIIPAIARLVCGLSFALAVSTDATAKTLRMNAGDSPGSLVETGMRKFKELIEARTNKEYEIRIFMGGQLGGPQESLENLKTGSLELYGGDMSFFATVLPEELGVITLLYFFSDNDHLRRYLKSDYFQKGHDEKLVKRAGARFISTAYNGDRGPYRVFLSSKPVLKPEDVVGIKMRLWPNEVVIRQWRHLGAVPSVMAWDEVYLAIRQNTIQAVTGPLADMRATKFTEVAPFVTEHKEFPQILPFSVSEKFWQSLPEPTRKIFVDSANEALAHYAQLVRDSGEDTKRFLIQKDNATFIQMNTELFRKKIEPFYETLIKENVISKAAYDAANAVR